MYIFTYEAETYILRSAANRFQDKVLHILIQFML